VIVVLDNRDSFVFNLARCLHLLGGTTRVVSSHGLDANDVRSLAPTAIVISPGPCTPDEAGCSVDVVRQFRGRVPILGVCLGHQAIAVAAGRRGLTGQPSGGRRQKTRYGFDRQRDQRPADQAAGGSGPWL